MSVFFGKISLMASIFCKHTVSKKQRMMRPLLKHSQFNDFHKLMLLQIAVKTFSISKLNTGSTTSYVIHWAVEGPEAGFDLFLNERRINNSGTITVAVENTCRFKLKAKMGKFCRLLSCLTPETEIERWNMVELFLGMNILPLAMQVVASNPFLTFRKAITEESDLLPHDLDIRFCGNRWHLRLPVEIKFRRIRDAIASIQLTDNRGSGMSLITVPARQV
jgi:hypothetical protein